MNPVHNRSSPLTAYWRSSALREAISVGATNEAPGRPKQSSAPSGGGAVRAAASVGAYV